MLLLVTLRGHLATAYFVSVRPTDSKFRTQQYGSDYSLYTSLDKDVSTVWRKKSAIVDCEPKRVPLHSCPQLFQMPTDFQNYFTLRLSSEFNLQQSRLPTVPYFQERVVFRVDVPRPG